MNLQYEKPRNIAVLIPCYNESKTVEKVISDWQTELPEAKIYVYDNNSTDDTGAISENAGAFVKKEYVKGKGNVMRRMFREIDAECYVMVDGDDTYSASRAKEMVSMVLEKNVDMVIGDRLSSKYFQENKRPLHNFGNILVRKAINVLFHCDVKDIMTGCRAFSYQFVKTFPVLSKGFEIETEMTIHAVVNNMNIQNVVIDYKNRPAGESKLNTFSDGLKVIKTIIRLFKNYKPFCFFGFLGSLLLLFAAILFIKVFAVYLKTGLVPNFPTLIVSGFMALAAILSIFSGLILNTLIEQHRQDFEFKLLQVNELKKINDEKNN